MASLKLAVLQQIFDLHKHVAPACNNGLHATLIFSGYGNRRSH
jgi:hypothetical protein